MRGGSSSSPRVLQIIGITILVLACVLLDTVTIRLTLPLFDVLTDLHRLSV